MDEYILQTYKSTLRCIYFYKMLTKEEAIEIIKDSLHSENVKKAVIELLKGEQNNEIHSH